MDTDITRQNHSDFRPKSPLQTEIQYLKGVGPKRAALYHKLGILTVGDLLEHYPRSYIHFSDSKEIIQTQYDQVCSVRARVISKSGEQHIRKGLSVFKVRAADDTAEILLTFYNTKYTVDSLKIEQEYYFYGKIGGSAAHREMSSPMVFPLMERALLFPIYPLTAGLSSKMIAANAGQALDTFRESLVDFLPFPIRQEYQLCQRDYAVETIHRPPDLACAEIAKRRLIFDEFFLLALALAAVKGKNKAQTGCPMQEAPLEPFYASLPFSPTGAQIRAIEEIRLDICRQQPMNRLVQGDVGSGKTLVAAAACYLVKQNGYQSAMMAPTEILAVQHYHTLSSLLGGLGVTVAVLTASQPASVKRTIRQELASGKIDLCVGTHALLSEEVSFQNLALVVTDEQHRFGVAQRVKLAQKGENPHLLVMSATPIPRTLALLVYGDLDISVIDQLPPNRQPIATYRITSAKRQRAYQFMKDHLDEGRQAYIVCPLIEQGEIDLGLRPAVDYAHELAETAFQGYSVGLLHGKMKQSEKDRVMGDFQEGKIQLLVSTTVIEVGVDVPNAVIMMIENAERFGLSQLHQLRGRVGRGKYKSSCILLSDARNPETLQRLKVMCQTSDGFAIAEFDLKMRGPGDFLGYRQHGLPQLAIADMAKDIGLLQAAQEAAKKILDADPSLASPEHREMRRLVQKLLANVGERVN